MSRVKAINITVIVSAVLAAVGVSLFFLSIQMQPHGYMGVQTDAIPQSHNLLNNCTRQVQTYDPGPLGGFMCPIMFFQTYTKVNIYSGFDDVCLDSRYGADNYVLKPGHDGSITYTIYPDLPFSYAIQFPHVNMTNDARFSHPFSQKGSTGWTYTATADGVSVSFEPKSETLWPWSSPQVNTKIHATQDAKSGSYWLLLSPGVCDGGPELILTIDNSTRK
ncbi:MAG: hypothetical protein KGL95_02935 [Patescibacteria group bacterium]|nr:hypothetical protein [Patescibacteria group bacterium]